MHIRRFAAFLTISAALAVLAAAQTSTFLFAAYYFTGNSYAITGGGANVVAPGANYSQGLGASDGHLFEAVATNNANGNPPGILYGYISAGVAGTFETIAVALGSWWWAAAEVSSLAR